MEITGSDALVLTAVFIVIGSIGFPIIIELAARGRLAPNRFIGLRSDALLSDPVAWIAGHRAARAPIALSCAAALVLALIALAIPIVPVQAIALFMAAVALLGGGLLGLTRADAAANDAHD
ncbi:hypothetical protein [Microcella sp.]|uniref:hypothetical protein n=1 Tax=Microcella sp. TaxID=1913979 RepID=UPI003F7031C3